MYSNKSKRWHRIVALGGFLGSLMLAVPDVQAVPSMGRQTGYTCARCHTVFPELTPFGRQFKLGAFSMSSDKSESTSILDRLPFSGALKASRVKTSETGTPGAMPADFPLENKLFAETVAAYYGGKITDNSGALVQYNYDGIEKRWGMEMFDVRYANSMTLAGKETAFGVTLNNSPTVSDIFNSTPSWGFPNGNGLTKMPASALVDMTLASKVGGVGLYGMWNDLIYAEVASYRTAKTGIFRPLGWGVPQDEVVLDGNAPYWRLALQNETGPNSCAVGTYGLIGNTRSDPNDAGAGTDHFRDIGVDASYQYIMGSHIMSAHGNLIREWQTWNQNAALGRTASDKGTLNTFRADVRYSFQRKWAGGLQYFQTQGSSNPLYATGDAVMGSTNASPNTNGWVAEVNYLPLPNLKLSLRYTAFQKFNGASTDYVPGRNASDNNNLYLTAWLPF